MRAGKLRNYVEIQQPVETFNTNGELILSYITFTHCWVSIEPLIGREFWASKQIVGEITGKIRMRYINGVTNKMKVIDGAKTYEIEAVLDPENAHIELVLLVKEVA